MTNLSDKRTYARRGVVNARVTYEGAKGKLVAVPTVVSSGRWQVQMVAGDVKLLRASQFSVDGVAPEPVEAPAAAPDPEPETGRDSGEEEEEEGGFGVANQAFVLLTRTVNGTGHTDPSEFCATSI